MSYDNGGPMFPEPESLAGGMSVRLLLAGQIAASAWSLQNMEDFDPRKSLHMADALIQEDKADAQKDLEERYPGARGDKAPMIPDDHDRLQLERLLTLAASVCFRSTAPYAGEAVDLLKMMRARISGHPSPPADAALEASLIREWDNFDVEMV